MDNLIFLAASSLANTRSKGPDSQLQPQLYNFKPLFNISSNSTMVQWLFYVYFYYILKTMAKSKVFINNDLKLV